ncbi:unnamed protein product [Moneuplotes crassus]|uniref:Uncharacterized protein n=1 Tax=Euplotes crassus TaxID=5936 RepID=A0AAD2D947_EUPCR|nr:unnamed protein product [Moneuplotes crassus]
MDKTIYTTFGRTTERSVEIDVPRIEKLKFEDNKSGSSWKFIFDKIIHNKNEDGDISEMISKAREKHKTLSKAASLNREKKKKRKRNKRAKFSQRAQDSMKKSSIKNNPQKFEFNQSIQLLNTFGGTEDIRPSQDKGSPQRRHTSNNKSNFIFPIKRRLSQKKRITSKDLN